MSANVWRVCETSYDAEGEEFEPGSIEEYASLRDAKNEGIGRFLHADQADEWPIRSPRWLEFQNHNDGTREFYEEGIRRDRSLHFPDSVTQASRLRVCRLFGLRASSLE